MLALAAERARSSLTRYNPPSDDDWLVTIARGIVDSVAPSERTLSLRAERWLIDRSLKELPCRMDQVVRGDSLSDLFVDSLAEMTANSLFSPEFEAKKYVDYAFSRLRWEYGLPRTLDGRVRRYIRVPDERTVNALLAVFYLAAADELDDSEFDQALKRLINRQVLSRIVHGLGSETRSERRSFDDWRPLGELHVAPTQTGPRHARGGLERWRRLMTEAILALSQAGRINIVVERPGMTSMEMRAANQARGAPSDVAHVPAQPQGPPANDERSFSSLLVAA